MNDREIILGMIEEYLEEKLERRMPLTAEHFADYLIANGVTIQERGEWFVYRCPKCNGSGIDYSETKKPREIKCPNCGAKMDLEEEE